MKQVIYHNVCNRHYGNWSKFPCYIARQIFQRPKRPKERLRPASAVLVMLCYAMLNRRLNVQQIKRKGNWNFCSRVLSLPGAKVPPMELLLPGTFVPWNFRSRERK